MQGKHLAPVIQNYEDFQLHLPDYLDGTKTTAVFLDYDGTLAPIADHPSRTVMTTSTSKLLNKLAEHQNIFLSIISGRSLDNVKNKVNISNITYAGNHGIEIESCDGSRHDYILPEDIQSNYTDLVKSLRANVEKNQAWVEDKRYSLTYHYRSTPADLKVAQNEKAKRIIESYGFIASPAHEAIEAKPPIEWNKGAAVLFILQQQFGEDWHDKVNAIYAGDDTTDEDAMRVLHGLGKSFRISANKELQTFADFRLPHQHQINDLMRWILQPYRN